MEKEEKKRTLKQNRALHLMFTQLAQELNDAGYDMRKTLKHDIEIPWNSKTIKEFLWRPVMKAQLRKSSTTELTTKDIDKVFSTIHRYLAIKFGLEIQWPSIETLMMDQKLKE